MIASGDIVTLTPQMRKIAVYPERYERGMVERASSWGIVYVKWNGCDRPIMMREDELEVLNGG